MSNQSNKKQPHKLRSKVYTSQYPPKKMIALYQQNIVNYQQLKLETILITIKLFEKMRPAL